MNIHEDMDRLQAGCNEALKQLKISKDIVAAQDHRQREREYIMRGYVEKLSKADERIAELERDNKVMAALNDSFPLEIIKLEQERNMAISEIGKIARENGLLEQRVAGLEKALKDVCKNGLSYSEMVQIARAALAKEGA